MGTLKINGNVNIQDLLTLKAGTDAYTTPSIAFGSDVLIGYGSTIKNLGIYSSNKIYLRPNNGTLGYSDGIELSVSSLIPTKNNIVTLGSSTNKWSNVYATTFTGALSGNATTATTLATARTLTIGSTGKTFNGSANVSWSLAEIGASDRSLLLNNSVSFTVNGDANTYYPVIINNGHGSLVGWTELHISRRYNDTAPNSWNTSTHKGGLTLSLRWTGDNNWGGNDKRIMVDEFNETYTTMVGGMALTTGCLVVWLRGGGAVYYLSTPYGKSASATPYLTTYTDPAGTAYSSRTYNSSTVNSEVKSKWLVRSDGFYGNATYATSAGTAGACNGTTLEWSGSIAWADTSWIAAWNSDGSKIKALSKSSFAPASHTHSYLPLSGGTMSGALALVSNKYYTDGNYGINCNNSDIVDLNGLYFGDAVDGGGEGINFYRASGTWDTIYTKSGDLYFHPNRTTATTPAGYTVLHSNNYTSYTVTKTGGGASGTWGINITGNAAYASKAGNVAYQSNVTWYAPGTGSTAGWYRIYQFAMSNASSPSAIIHLSRSYNSPENEGYIFAITVGYNGHVQITQLSGYTGGHLVSKIRVDYTNSGSAYVDFYMGNQSYNNQFVFYGSGYGTFVSPYKVSSPTGSTYEFTTVTGFKCDRQTVTTRYGSSLPSSGYTGEIYYKT